MRHLKTSIPPLVTVSLLATEGAALLNLRGHKFLRNNEKLRPFEQIAHLETFDEVPIFGGEDLRQTMLQTKKGTKATAH